MRFFCFPRTREGESGLRKSLAFLATAFFLCSCSSTSPSLAAGPLWRAGIFDAQVGDALAEFPAIVARLKASSHIPSVEDYMRAATRGDETLTVKFFPSSSGLLITAAYVALPGTGNSTDWELMRSEQEGLDTALWQGRLDIESYLASTRSLEEKKWKIVLAQAGDQRPARGEFLRQFWKRLCEQVKPSAASSLYAEAETAYESGRQKSAFYKYLAVLTDFPGSIHERVALERCFEIAASLINSSWGVERAAEILEKYPCAPNADRLRYLIGSTYLAWGDYEEAVSHFERAFEDYPESQLAPTALYLCGKSHLCQYQGSNYEAKPLIEAKETFEKYLRLYPAHEKADEVRTSLRDAQEKLALRDLNVAKFYLRTGKKTSAAAYLRGILTNYSQTDCAKDAASLLASIEKEESQSSQPEKR